MYGTHAVPKLFIKFIFLGFVNLVQLTVYSFNPFYILVLSFFDCTAFITLCFLDCLYPALSLFFVYSHTTRHAFSSSSFILLCLVIIFAFLCTSSHSYCFCSMLYQAACQEFTLLNSGSMPSFLILSRPLILRCHSFFLALVLLSGDAELNPGPHHLSIRSFLHSLYFTALPDLIDCH